LPCYHCYGVSARGMMCHPFNPHVDINADRTNANGELAEGVAISFANAQCRCNVTVVSDARSRKCPALRLAEEEQPLWANS
jgi:hypothetical protein